MNDEEFWKKFEELRVETRKKYFNFKENFRIDCPNTVRLIELKVAKELTETERQEVLSKLDDLLNWNELDFDVEDRGDCVTLFGDEPYNKICKGRFLRQLNEIASITLIEINFIFKPK